MSTRYEFSFQVSDALLRRAMTSWNKPEKSWKRTATFFAVCLAIGVAIGAVLALTDLFDRMPDGLVHGLLIGFYLGLLVWYFTHRYSLKKIASMSARQVQRQGPSHAVFTAKEARFRSNLGEWRADWAGYDQVIALRDATVLRSGGVVYPVPHDALPEGVAPAQFHADIVAWQEAAQ